MDRLKLIENLSRVARKSKAKSIAIQHVCIYIYTYQCKQSQIVYGLSSTLWFYLSNNESGEYTTTTTTNISNFIRKWIWTVNRKSMDFFSTLCALNAWHRWFTSMINSSLLLSHTLNCVNRTFALLFRLYTCTF